MSFQENQGTAMDKYAFFNNYENLSRHIREGQSCFAIANEWWSNFEMILSIAKSDPDMMIPDFGPINNTSLVNLSDTYQDLIRPVSSEYYINQDKLIDLKDWDQMSIKTNLRYNDDFVLLSQSVWRFLKTKFSGGPEIELIPEKKSILMKDVCVVTHKDDNNIQEGLIVSFDLIKIYWIRDGNYELLRAMYVSDKVLVRHLQHALARHCMMNPDKSMILATPEDTTIELGSALLTLADYKITENQYLNIVQRSSTDVGTKSNEKGNNADNMFEMNDLNGNIVKGGEVGEYPPKNNNNNNDVQKNDFPDIELFKTIMSSKTDQPAISLDYKHIPEIRQNLNKLLQEWTLVNSNADKIDKV